MLGKFRHSSDDPLKTLGAREDSNLQPAVMSEPPSPDDPTNQILRTTFAGVRSRLVPGYHWRNIGGGNGSVGRANHGRPVDRLNCTPAVSPPLPGACSAAL